MSEHDRNAARTSRQAARPPRTRPPRTASAFSGWLQIGARRRNHAIGEDFVRRDFHKFMLFTAHDFRPPAHSQIWIAT